MRFRVGNVTVRYQGTKYPYAQEIAKVLASSGVSVYYEPFCGSLSVATAVAAYGRVDKMFLSDVHEDLVDMYRAAMDGWRPRVGSVAAREYEQLRRAEPSPWRTWVGYNCSYASDWFRGYSEDHKTVTVDLVDRLDWSVRILESKSVEFRSCDYRKVEPEAGSVVYCDPPYFDSAPYRAAGVFRPEVGGQAAGALAFWEQVIAWSKRARVFVSEYQAPPPWKCVWECAVRVHAGGVAAGKGPKIERLFTLGDSI